ncbi:hypothetical protein C8R44DRAFT_815808 [Mycena epipterygia]|nr:hypothetical protein C8R44DRAFT_815808 [Mycena epipterygia]
MASISASDPNRVEIYPISKRIPPNPLLSYNGTKTEPASVWSRSSAGSVSQSLLAHRILLYDQRCLLTGAVSTDIQACHLINAIRTKNDLIKIRLKSDVQSILSRQCFNGQQLFFLDSLSNCVPIEVQWHGSLDKQGAYCFGIPLNQLSSIFIALIQSNTEWDLRAETDAQAPRNLDTTQAPFRVEKCVVLVLRPELFLPDNRPILINTAPSLRVPGQARPVESARSDWIPHYLLPNQPYLVDGNSNMFKEFVYRTQRLPEAALSVFALLINANSKLQNVKNRPHPPELTPFILLIENVVNLIFHVPPHLDTTLPSSVPPLPQQTHVSNSFLQDESTQTHGGHDTDADSNNERDNEQDTDAHDDEHEEDDDDDYDDDDDEDGPDTIHGMTLIQKEDAIRECSDGQLPARDRAQAAMRMLGMAGPPRSQYFSPLIDT